MSKYTFQKHSEETSKVEHALEAVSWREIADEFYLFLLGCGFVLKREDLSKHFEGWED